MTPKEKAQELIDKFYCINNSSSSFMTTFQAKQCALIVAYEIRLSIVAKNDDERLVYELGGNKYYWQEVSQEIVKL